MDVRPNPGAAAELAPEPLSALSRVDRASAESLQAAVYDALKSVIVKGRLTAGQRLFEKDVADRLGVSRTPLREALRRLEAQGLVVFTEGRRGFEVVDPIDDAAVVYEMRQRLEGLAAKLAADVITVPELETLNRIQARMVELLDGETSGSIEELATLNTDFHALVNTASRRPRLIALIEQLSPIYISRQIVMLYSQEELRHSFSEHAQILASLWDRDGDRAERLIHEHLKGGQRFILGTGLGNGTATQASSIPND